MSLAKAAPWIAAFSLATACLTRKFECPEGEAQDGARCLPQGADAGADLGSGDDDGDDSDDGSPDSSDRDAAVQGTDPGASGSEADTGTPSTCYVDADGDGEGTDVVAECGGEGASDRSGDCDDGAADVYPGALELCDARDNDCDGRTDNDAANACGGPCQAALSHAPGDACDNGLLGACARTGTYVCAGTDRVSCNALAASPSAELCDDGIDNDCNGRVDEPAAVNAVTWYQDCDGDGYAASAQGAVPGCTAPAPLAGCAWTAIIPSAATRTNWDCDDNNPRYSPKAVAGSPSVGSDWDLDCNGTPAPDRSARNLNSAQAVSLSPNKQPTTCNATALTALNGGQCANISVSANLPCIAWRRASGTYADTPDVYCPDAPLMFRGEGTSTPCELVALPPAYGCK